jgi:energy-converting hydrogenase A subunit M
MKNELTPYEENLRVNAEMDAWAEILGIEVKDFTEVTMQSFTAGILKEVQDAKNLLKEHGYYVDNLWCVADVIQRYECTEEEAQEVLEKALNYESVYELVWEGISYEAEDMNLKRRD